VLFFAIFSITNTVPKPKKMINIKNRKNFHKNRYLWYKEKAVILHREILRNLRKNKI